MARGGGHASAGRRSSITTIPRAAHVLQVPAVATCEHLVDRSAHRPWWEDKTRNESCYVNVREAQPRAAATSRPVLDTCAALTTTSRSGRSEARAWAVAHGSIPRQGQATLDSARGVAAFRGGSGRQNLGSSRPLPQLPDKNAAMFVDCWVRGGPGGGATDCLRRFGVRAARSGGRAQISSAPRPRPAAVRGSASLDDRSTRGCSTTRRVR